MRSKGSMLYSTVKRYGMILCFSLFSCLYASAQSERMIHFAHSYMGQKYELRKMDCVILVENLLAHSLTEQTGCDTLFSRILEQVQYKDGIVSYPTRLHYFSAFIDNGVEHGWLSKAEYPNGLKTARRRVTLNFMSSHASLYPELKDTAVLHSIRIMEKEFENLDIEYIPKSQLKRYSLLKQCINNGDIIAIVTNKQGLDYSHVGIASWHADGTLHLINASQIHKKVIDEPMTLYDYMQRHPSQLGISVIKVN